MTRVSTPSFSWSASQLARSRSRATTERQAANGTKLSAIRPSTGSRLSSSAAPAPTRIVNSTRRISPALITIRMPSMSSMPRVISSPVCTRSWKPKLSRCSCA